MKKLSLIVLGFLVLTSCATKEEMMQKNFSAAWDEYFVQDFDSTKVVDVLVATNRQPKNDTFSCEDDQFGVKLDQTTRFGVCKISVPKKHHVGEIELAKDNRQSSQSFFKIAGATPLQATDLIAQLKDSKRYPLVFVHGFNVRYQEAALRAAQIAYDMKYQGPIVLFTWPAGAGYGFMEDKMLNKIYADNMVNAHNTIEPFKNFLLELQKNNIRINLVVHSMGHQLVLPALKMIADNNSADIFINQLVLNAPDFEVAKFRQFAPDLKKVSKRTTLYCSQNDKAIIASRTFNNNARLGSCAVVEGVDVINVGLIDESTLGLGHGYYSSRAILGDVFQTLIGIEAGKRLFIARSDPNSSDQYFLRK